MALKLLNPPSGLLPTLPCNFYRDTGTGAYSNDMDFSPYKGGTILYVSPTGSDSNDGLTLGTAFATLLKAFATARVGGDPKYEIRCSLEQSNSIVQGVFVDKTVSLVSTSVSGRTIINSNSVYTWTLDGAGTYKTTLTDAVGVVDLVNLDTNSIPVPLSTASSVANCQATAGTFYTDGAELWVHRSDGILPTYDNTVVTRPSGNFSPESDNTTFYFENISFMGYADGNALFMKGTFPDPKESTLIYNGCYFIASDRTQGQGLKAQSIKNCWSFDCFAPYCQVDGFNYRNAVDEQYKRQCLMLEFNCQAYDCGLETPGARTNQVSSAHEGVSVFRVKTVGGNCTGRNIFDVGGCYSVNYGCNIDLPQEDAGAKKCSYSFRGDQDRKAVAYMIDCIATNCDQALIVDEYATVNIQNFQYDGVIENLLDSTLYVMEDTLALKSIKTTTYDNLFFDAGVAYINFTDFTTPGTLLGATRGGGSFVIEQDVRDMQADGAQGLVKGARRVINSIPRLTISLLEMSKEQFLRALPASVSAAFNVNWDKVTRSSRISASDYISNITLVCEVAGKTGAAGFQVQNVLSDANLEISFVDKDESVLSLTYTGHYLSTNLETEPWEILYPNT